MQPDTWHGRLPGEAPELQPDWVSTDGAVLQYAWGLVGLSLLLELMLDWIVR